MAAEQRLHVLHSIWQSENGTLQPSEITEQMLSDHMYTYGEPILTSLFVPAVSADYPIFAMAVSVFRTDFYGCFVA
ncbi:MAG: hypothetical protein ACLSCV_04735 [Acutalibacteraceae bacterium]